VLKRPRVHLHFTPTSASWINLVECWFSLLQRRALARAAFASTDALEAALRAYIAATNAALKPFVWTKTADEILASVKRYCQRTPRADHSQYLACSSAIVQPFSEIASGGGR
jgi:hypothetical protein